ncbi:hypothetical protein BDN67DRAFT_428215 [Paxillus ammoniavirescens]|nr:hypothetical protein BDN67DRAFT_428215 [Paxillus ammoniavirescens]
MIKNVDSRFLAKIVWVFMHMPVYVCYSREPLFETTRRGYFPFLVYFCPRYLLSILTSTPSSIRTTLPSGEEGSMNFVDIPMIHCRVKSDVRAPCRCHIDLRLAMRPNYRFQSRDAHPAWVQELLTRESIGKGQPTVTKLSEQATKVCQVPTVSHHKGETPVLTKASHQTL